MATPFIKKVQSFGQRLLRRIGNEMLTFGRFLITKTFIIHLLIVGLLVSGIFLGLSQWLKAYTNHGEALSLPDFRGLTLEEVEELATEKNLRFEVVDSVYTPRGQPGSVIEQNPPPEFKVKEGRRIFLTIKKTTREKVTLSALRDLSLFQARADIASLGLRVDSLVHKPSEFHDLVLNVRYQGKEVFAGEKIPKGDNLTLVVGKQADEKAEVPNLITLKLDDARNMALNQAMNLGAVLYDESIRTVQDSLNARVWRQVPAVGSDPVPLGSAIDVYLTVSKVKLDVAEVSNKYN